MDVGGTTPDRALIGRGAARFLPQPFYFFGRLTGGTTPLTRYAVTSLP